LFTRKTLLDLFLQLAETDLLKTFLTFPAEFLPNPTASQNRYQQQRGIIPKLRIVTTTRIFETIIRMTIGNEYLLSGNDLRWFREQRRGEVS